MFFFCFLFVTSIIFLPGRFSGWSNTKFCSRAQHSVSNEARTSDISISVSPMRLEQETQWSQFDNHWVISLLVSNFVDLTLKTNASKNHLKIPSAYRLQQSAMGKCLWFSVKIKVFQSSLSSPWNYPDLSTLWLWNPISILNAPKI